MSALFDADGFRAFVAGKPSWQWYDSTNSERCALAQFGFKYVTSADCPRLGLPEDVYYAAIGSDTFGQLSRKLRPSIWTRIVSYLRPAKQAA